MPAAAGTVAGHVVLHRILRALYRTLPIVAVVLAGAALGLRPSAPAVTTPARNALAGAVEPVPAPRVEPEPRTAEPAPSPPSPAPTAPAPAPDAALAACDANISVDAGTTTCALAQNAFYAFWLNREEPEVFADAPGIPAYSPTAKRTVHVSCSGSATVACTAPDGSSVSFPAAAVDAYTQADGARYAATHDLGGVPAPTPDAGPGTAAQPAVAPASDGQPAIEAEPAREQPPGAGSAADEPACHPSYSAACLDPAAVDYDCEDGSGDGPEYTGRVEVTGDDPYGLDRDGDGVACDW